MPKKALRLDVSMSSKKSIFEYDNYRDFLRAYYLSAKAENKNFSFRYFSRISGFKSSNFLNLVMKGKSNISIDSIDRLVQAMKLNKEESTFFKNLVHFNQSETQKTNKFIQKNSSAPGPIGRYSPWESISIVILIAGIFL